LIFHKEDPISGKFISIADGWSPLSGDLSALTSRTALIRRDVLRTESMAIGIFYLILSSGISMTYIAIKYNPFCKSVAIFGESVIDFDRNN